MAVILGALFRVFLVAFHGYLAYRMWLLYSDVIPRIERLDATSRSPSEVKVIRAQLHSRMRPYSGVAGALQVFGILMALVAPLSALTGFGAWACAAFVGITAYWPHLERVKQIEAREQQRHEILDSLAAGPVPHRTFATRKRPSLDILDELTEDGLVERVNAGTPYDFIWCLTPEGEGFVRLRGIRKMTTPQLSTR